MRTPPVALLVLSLAGPVLPGAVMPARAQEPLLLRIRPNTAPLPEGIGSGENLSDADAAMHAAMRARAAREAVWERAERRARIAIASVCSNCLPPAPLIETNRAAHPGLAPDRKAEANPPDPLADPLVRTEGDL